MKTRSVFLSCCILVYVILLLSGCNSRDDGEDISKDNKVETEFDAGFQYNNEMIIAPKTLYQINDLEAFFKGKTFADQSNEEGILSLADALTYFPDAYLRCLDYNESQMLYLAYPVKEGGTYLVTLLLPMDVTVNEESSIIVDSAFRVHNLPAKEAISMFEPGVSTLGDIEQLHAPMLRGLISSVNSTSYYLLDEGVCAVVTSDAVPASFGSDPIIHSIKFISIENSPFSAFLKSDLEDNRWVDD